MEHIRFRYNPHLYSDQILIRDTNVCSLCGKKVMEYIDQIYAAEEVECICLPCVHDGSAAAKYGGEFV